MKRSFVFITILLPTLITLLAPVSASADIQVVIEENGSESDNDVSLSHSQSTDITQSNTATIQNNITQHVDTGGNTSNGNSGDVSITTGDVTSGTTLSNTVNSSVVQSNCCNGDTNITVSGNGAQSTNTVTSTSTVNTNINVYQTATIDNDIDIYGNTGRNDANFNSGDVTITTGNISGWINMVNAANNTTVLTENGVEDINVLIENNGARSTNEVVLSLLGNVNIWKNQLATIDNDIYADLNTGKNDAKYNLGDVLIRTGDVDFAVDVKNGPINTSTTEVLCCDDGAPVEPEKPHKPSDNPVTPPTSGQNPSPANGGPSSVGQVLGNVTDMLPVTGASAIHFWIMSVVYLLTFLSGLYLRLRAGRSPDFAGYKLLAH